MIKFIFRVFYITLVRFFVLTTLLTSLRYFDASPFPQEASVITLSYIFHALITFLFAKWVFAKRTSPTWTEAGIVTGLFVVVEIVFELSLWAVITGGSFIGALQNFTWQSFVIILIYILAVYTAAWQTRTSRARRANPSGMEM
ncbi:hypothetical protein COX00_04435 [Candidatus Uhrbacteria bacterium CG22_combo_CG10-13_8_21_14_all_47_17]|uniref:Uncharacterized protein n=1 Tax=Candidatus Uhrbacteria bacterium CG22_combo_CG10-13_8_21_14_all_47_17 TaxID=1975041 RepID=A0A2H0BRG8_9BACT|nr:MAG: hypothetical protein COX00_04435 [Candidatus Uhrbacteria bacterium CG22_combo_CG10-13_8_21_14_all_47_17]